MFDHLVLWHCPASIPLSTDDLWHCIQEHEAWLEVPQELATLDSGKTDPLLGVAAHAKQDTDVKSAKDSNHHQLPNKMSLNDDTDSATQKVAEKLNQV